MENNRSNDHLPRCIEVYNKILKNIKSGLYNGENKLPGENKLAEQMGVSRMTLFKRILQLQIFFLLHRKAFGHCHAG